MATLLLATSNPGKLREVVALLPSPLDIRLLSDFPHLSPVEEDADSFRGNAEKKALTYARATGLWTLADDSGLEVDALMGAPGVHSARFAGPARRAEDNNRKLIDLLRHVPAERRVARFRCCMTLADPDGVRAFSESVVEGRIIDEPRGANGFGYDPHFLLPELDLTMAELPTERKNNLSHRGQALRAMLPSILRLVMSAGSSPAGSSL